MSQSVNLYTYDSNNFSVEILELVFNQKQESIEKHSTSEIFLINTLVISFFS